MSDVATLPSAPAKAGLMRLLIVNIPYLALYVIAVWLIALTDRDPTEAAMQWQFFIPLVALVSIIDGWADRRDHWATYLTKQVLHWGTLMAVTWLMFLPEMAAFMNSENHGFVVSYMLGLTAVLSGIYLEWKMSVFGAFLILSDIGIAYLSDNALLVALVGVALFGIVVTLLLRRRPKSED